MTTRSGDTAEQLLNAVDDVIAEHGPSGVTLRRVGTAAGLSHTAAAHYYSDKPGLFTAYVTRAWNRVADRLDEAATAADTRERLLRAAEAYASFAQAEPSAFSVMSRLELTNVDAPELWAARERGFFTLAGLVEAHQVTGWATQQETLDVLATVWSMVHGFVDLWVGGPLWAPYDGNELTPTLLRLVEPLLDSLA
jgi:AcrR family transcriptional regulator